MLTFLRSPVVHWGTRVAVKSRPCRHGEQTSPMEDGKTSILVPRQVTQRCLLSKRWCRWLTENISITLDIYRETRNETAGSCAMQTKDCGERDLAWRVFWWENLTSSKHHTSSLLHMECRKWLFLHTLSFTHLILLKRVWDLKINSNDSFRLVGWLERVYTVARVGTRPLEEKQ